LYTNEEDEVVRAFTAIKKSKTAIKNFIYGMDRKKCVASAALENSGGPGRSCNCGGLASKS